MKTLINPHSPWLFEYELKKLLQYATLWKAVVLLDEADVFLEARDEKSGDGTRNSLVAVFLKELEYFAGIVFLTTNRLKSFDHAMKSRIHLALGYGPPGDDVRRMIWKQCLEGVPVGERALEDIDDMAETLSTVKLNGREISNAVNTARTIARFKKMRLQEAHIDTVLNVKAEFDVSIHQERKKLTSTDTTDFAKGSLLRQNSILSEEPESF
jgi:SpoVK/Ycf46/Vps4 family AAA+-type ATPase